MSTEFRSLPVPLTDEELKLRSHQLATKIKDKAQIEIEKCAAKDGFKSRLQDVEGALQDLSTAVKEQREHRPVECFWVENLKCYTMDLLRGDTQVCVDTRPMTHAERQKSFEFAAGSLRDDEVVATADASAKPRKGKKRAQADANESP